MITYLIITALYLFGYWLAFSMLRIEHASEKETYTKGQRLMAIALSLLSLFMVLWLCVSAWIAKINVTGYWDQPVIEDKEVEIIEVKEKPKTTRK
jgi:hypothetical protein